MRVSKRVSKPVLRDYGEGRCATWQAVLTKQTKKQTNIQSRTSPLMAGTWSWVFQGCSGVYLLPVLDPPQGIVQPVPVGFCAIKWVSIRSDQKCRTVSEKIREKKKEKEKKYYQLVAGCLTVILRGKPKRSSNCWTVVYFTAQKIFWLPNPQEREQVLQGFWFSFLPVLEPILCPLSVVYTLSRRLTPVT